MKKRPVSVCEHTSIEYVLTREGHLSCSSFFSFPCPISSPIPECSGTAFLDSDAGRWEGVKWSVRSFACTPGKNMEALLSGGPFELSMTFFMDETGVCSLRTSLRNTDTVSHTIYGCYPRFVLWGGGFEVYSEYSAWCAEDQGAFSTVHAGNLTLTNSAGCSTTGSAPFACLYRKDTGRFAAMHVLPVGDWMIRIRRIAGHRTGYTLLEAGLSDAGLRLQIAPGAQLQLPELLLYGFSGDLRQGSEMIQRYLLCRYPDKRSVSPVYNSWFFGFDDIQVELLKQQAEAAAKVGCAAFVVDAGWFGKGLDWENQVGCWEECRERAFKGRLREFADYVRSLGMRFGLWMEPERAGVQTDVYLAHPDWFMRGDAVVFDLKKPEVADYLAGQVKDVIRRYDVRWMKIDFNTDMFRDLTGTCYYEYALAQRALYERIQSENPDCTFEGCAAGGGRTDIHNMLENFHGHFISDTVHPLEILRMRQAITLRTRTVFTGSWAVLQQIPFPVSTYTCREKEKRNKILSAGDAWWEQTADYPLEFVLAVNLLGQFGFSGNLASLDREALAKVRQAVSFAERYREMMARSICHLLTMPKPLRDESGWAAFQYEDTVEEQHLLFAFRLAEEAEEWILLPQNLNPDGAYTIIPVNWCGGNTAAGTEEDAGMPCASLQERGKETYIKSGAAILCEGIRVCCPMHYEARIIILCQI